MTRTSLDRPRIEILSRRQALELAGGATVFTFWHRKAHGFPVPEHYIDHLAAERIADRDPPRPPILIDAQTHMWWRAGGVRQMSERGEHFLKSLAGSRASVVGHPVPIADMGRVMFLEDVFLGSETDIAFLNSFVLPPGVDVPELLEARNPRSPGPLRLLINHRCAVPQPTRVGPGVPPILRFRQAGFPGRAIHQPASPAIRTPIPCPRAC